MVESRVALYTIRTWDVELQAFTPQDALECVNVPLWTLKRTLKALKAAGWDVYYIRGADGNHDVNAPLVLVERTDGEPPPCGCRLAYNGDECQCGFPTTVTA